MFAVLLFLFSSLAFQAAAKEPPTMRSLSAEVICPCGCGLTVANCNHTTCSGRDEVRGKLKEYLKAGMTEEEILALLEQEYGKGIRAEPPMRGWDWSAWFLPLLALLGAVGTGGTLLSRWRRSETAETGPRVETAERSQEVADSGEDIDPKALEAFRKRLEEGE
ncbi:MAG: hypothetical protein D6679_09905 [Candidatus Hydrogenedentota bacterium]|nr:MAG: hypothetical protein D6679_09905 [Candidatus Hydrogenedentota bacterium]